MYKNNSKNLINFSKSYIDYLSQVLNKINKEYSDLEKLFRKTRQNNNTILFWKWRSSFYSNHNG